MARDAGYTRGAVYHQFQDKEDLTLAVLRWVDEWWQSEVGELMNQAPDPASALIAMARGHAILCRRDIARFGLALRIEFSNQDHPVGREVERVTGALIERCVRLIKAGRRGGSIPGGPPARPLALALLGAMEGTVIEVGGQAPYDEELAARAVAGVLGLDGPPARPTAD